AEAPSLETFVSSASTSAFVEPYLDGYATTNVTTQIGTHAYLPCRFLVQKYWVIPIVMLRLVAELITLCCPRCSRTTHIYYVDHGTEQLSAESRRHITQIDRNLPEAEGDPHSSAPLTSEPTLPTNLLDFYSDTFPSPGLEDYTHGNVSVFHTVRHSRRHR
ncbi:hypothetical protein DOY81_008940, partial [Sarcophaga bullata]